MTYVPKHRGEPKVVYRVRFIESERGWGRNEWETEYPTESEARAVVARSNAGNKFTGIVPDYYIVATYVGEVTL